MSGFCCWLAQLLVELLIGKLFDWAYERFSDRKTPKKPGKHFKGV